MPPVAVAGAEGAIGMSTQRPVTARAGGRRAELLVKLQRAAQTSTTEGILFHQAVADRVGLHVTDLRCLNVLAQAGPLTAGELGQRLGLGTTGAVTRMVDRLERASYVRREVDRTRLSALPIPTDVDDGDAQR